MIPAISRISFSQPVVTLSTSTSPQKGSLSGSWVYQISNNVEDIYKDEHLKVRDMLQDIDVPGLGKKKIAGVPVKFLRNPGSVKSPGPQLGFHTKEVMEQFGIKNMKDD